MPIIKLCRGEFIRPWAAEAAPTFKVKIEQHTMSTTDFSFGIEFLGPVILADPFRPERAEWPPAPSRVYAALIAATCEHRLGEAVLAAVRTLEGNAPAITASAASPYTPHQLAVRTAHRFNFSLLMPEPEISPASPVVAYHWRVPETAVDGIAQAVRCLSHVGRGESLVLGHVYPPGTAPAPNWVPDRQGSRRLRVPTPGRFEVLERDYQRGRATVLVEPAIAYRSVGDGPETTEGHGPWGELIALRVDRGDIRSAALLANGLRTAVLSILGNGAHPQIHGHECRDHVAWLALPNVGGLHGDGRVLGVGVLPPKHFDPEADRQLRLALLQVREIPFRSGFAQVSLPTQTVATLRHSTWAQPSKRWASATPVVLEHKVGADASRAIAQAIQRSGYPRPVKVWANVVPSLLGAVHAAETASRKHNGLPRRHAIVEFAEPIKGPLLVGGERYFGLGLFRPIARTISDAEFAGGSRSLEAPELLE